MQEKSVSLGQAYRKRTPPKPILSITKRRICDTTSNPFLKRPASILIIEQNLRRILSLGGQSPVSNSQLLIPTYDLHHLRSLQIPLNLIIRHMDAVFIPFF